MTNTVPGCCGMCDRQNIETGGTDAMRARIWIEALAFALLAAVCATVGPAIAQAPAPTNAGPVQPWGLPPLPPGVGPIEKFADISSTPQGKFLEGGSFDDQGNLWFGASVAVGFPICSPMASWYRWSTAIRHRRSARPASRK